MTTDTAASEIKRDAPRGSLSPGMRYRVNRRPASWERPLSEHERRLNRLHSATRTRGEHTFHVIKDLWGFTKVRYRGLGKNTARLFTMSALANL